MLCASTTSPTRVDVPWPSISVAVAGDTPAFCQARSTQNFWPTGLGAVMPFPLPSLDAADAAQHGVDLVPSRSASASASAGRSRRLRP